MNFYVKIIVAVLALLLLALGAIFLFASSDEAKIEQLIETGVSSARKGDADGVIALISRDFNTENEDHGAVADHIRRVCKDDRVRVASLAGVVVTVDGDEAEATFTVEGKLGPSRVGEVQVRLKLRREEDGWKVTWYERIR